MESIRSRMGDHDGLTGSTGATWPGSSGVGDDGADFYHLIGAGGGDNDGYQVVGSVNHC